MAAIAQEPSITSITWGSVKVGDKDQEIKKYTLRNKAQQEVDVITYGATVTAIRTPNAEKIIEDVVLGFDNIEGILIKITCLYESI